MGTPRKLRVTFKGNSLKEFAQHHLTDLSASGMFVRTESPLPVGTKVHFDFHLEDDSSLLEGEGVVLWVAEESSELSLPSGMELRFDSFSKESEERFHWLQLERRGVTVGREVPLSVATSSSPELEATRKAKAEQADEKEEKVDEEKVDEEKVDKGEKVDTKPGRPDTQSGIIMPLPATEEELLDRAEQALVARATLPFLRPDEVEPPPQGKSTALAPYRPKEKMAVQPSVVIGPASHREPVPASEPRTIRQKLEPPLGPGDSDPGKLFHYMANVSTNSSPNISPLSREPTILVDTDEAPVRSRWPLFFAGVVLCSVIALGVGWFVSSKRSSPPTSPTESKSAEQERRVRLATEPAGAEVVVDGKAMGRTPMDVLIRGTEKIQVRHPSFKPENISVEKSDPAWARVGDRLVLDVTLKLRPIGIPPEEASRKASALSPREGDDLLLKKTALEAKMAPHPTPWVRPKDTLSPARSKDMLPQARSKDTFPSRPGPPLKAAVAERAIREGSKKVKPSVAGTHQPAMANPSKAISKPNRSLPSDGDNKLPSPPPTEKEGSAAKPAAQKIKMPDWMEKNPEEKPAKTPEKKLKQPSWIESDPSGK